jgi:hypothetical protein
MKRREISNETKRKILLCAANILNMHGQLAGNRICQDWSGDEDKEPSVIFNAKERDDIEYNSQIRNSDLSDYEEGLDFLHDEMSASFNMSNLLMDMADNV